MLSGTYSLLAQNDVKFLCVGMTEDVVEGNAVPSYTGMHTAPGYFYS
jgi:hypothetical protein